MYSNNSIIQYSKELDIKFDKFTLQYLITGINIELEHGLINPSTNVTNDDLLITMKIALAHLNEFPKYYNKQYGLPAFEEFLKKKQ